jgi:hypothetical protein
MTGGKMGQIIDTPNNSTTYNDWALVTGTTVSNIINANLSFIQSIQGNYDYLVDLTVGNNYSNCEPGSTYNVQSDSFSLPPINYIQRLQDDLDSVLSSLQNALSDSGGMSLADMQTACNAANSDSSGSFSANEQALANSIYSWIQGGG